MANPQQLLLPGAQEFVKKLQGKGVMVRSFTVAIWEFGIASMIPVSEWTDDGQPHEFYIKIYGATDDLNVGLAKVQIGKGSYEGFLHFFTSAFPNNPAMAESSIINLYGVVPAIDAVLTL